jgi:Ca2+-transporting ATPase
VNSVVNWYNLDASEVLSRLGSDPKVGLSEGEAQRRLAECGPNELAGKKRVSAWQLFLEQFKNFLIIILLVAVALSAVLGEVADAIVIFVIVLFAAGLGFYQEYRAERALEALKRMAAPLAKVVRDGQEKEIPACEIVPGDIVILSTGDKVPADMRLIEAVNLKTDEALLTGESLPLEKTVESISGELSLGDRVNMAFMGTVVVYGRGRGVVTATGMRTEFGKIAALLQGVEKERTPLQINLDKLGKYIGAAALVLCFVLAGIGVMRGHEILEMVIWGVSLAVAAVPEALPAVVTISLALGVQRMAQRHALVRKLPAVETLGCTTFICSDKTGTLTQNQMTVKGILVDDKVIEISGSGYQPEGGFYHDGMPVNIQNEPGLKMLLEAVALCNDASLVCIDGNWQVKGDPTEGALLAAAAKAGLEQSELYRRAPRVREIPFSSEGKRMTTVHKTSTGTLVAYSKGAPEMVLEACKYIYRDGRMVVLDREERQRVLQVAHEMAEGALRVLGIAYKLLPEETSEAVDTEMVFLGLVGMTDPPREEAKDAVRLCEQAGIKSVMITGDHKLTAVAIAKELGLMKSGIALSGEEMDRISDEELERIVEKVEVYSRVSPAHKLRVVEALTKRGHVVAMTGDGVNDAPALKKADIGVAMGITGTDVSKEAADMVLTDDNFASIVAAVEEGRGIFDNIKKYLMYLLSSNIGEILLMAVAILFGPLIGLPPGAIPLIAIQILFVNLVTDGLPAIALSVDPAAPDVMQRKPRPRGQGVFTVPVVALIIVGGIWSCLVNLGIFKWALDVGKEFVEAQCLCFLTLIMIQFFKAYNFRSERHSVLKIGIFKNKWLNLAVGSQVLLMLVVIYVPFFQEVFHTYPLDGIDWALSIALSLSIFPVLELSKVMLRRVVKETP